MGNERSRNLIIPAVTGTAVAVGAAVGASYLAQEYLKITRDLHISQNECNEEFVVVNQLSPQKGDLIEIRRQPYAHWAVYVGNGYVIHLTGRVGDVEAKVLIQKLEDVVNGSKCRINNLVIEAQKRSLMARDADLIVKSAYERLNEIQVYDIFDNNCEHFVTECRFGQPFSLQSSVAQKDRPLLSAVGPVVTRIVNASNASNQINVQNSGKHSDNNQ